MAAPAPKLWSRAEYQRLGELGIFASQRVQLIEGTIYSFCPLSFLHARSRSRATTLLVKLFSDTHYVRVQCALFLNARSEPEPDFALVAHNLVDGPQVQDNPSFADLVIEVSDSSLKIDQKTKQALYASASLPEYWIVNLIDQQLEVYQKPVRSGRKACYESRTILSLDRTVAPLFAPNIRVPVAGLF